MRVREAKPEPGTFSFATCERHRAERFMDSKDFDWMNTEQKLYVLGHLAQDITDGFRVQDPAMHSPAQLMTSSIEHRDALLGLSND